MTYDELLDTANKKGLIVKEKRLTRNNGRIKGNRIAIRKDMTITEKPVSWQKRLATMKPRLAIFWICPTHGTENKSGGQG